ncbi:hypothetical protein [Phytohabitans houttuyneae]|uniref:Uncharacterized protein n=1 Tax=Phytohabitans houttuyneae TaxID=1076126 RepID=A0A6V8K7U1_9ACTN|nr:hypothetical protein [Phytohabitans houttuyneae]GFJ81272.1 hypothetical protein Phou_054520 [Phytohabitans houttuyneae]
MLPNQAAAFLENVIRQMFEAQSDRNGPREFQGILEWEITTGWDDGDQLTRLAVIPALAEWSDSYGGRVRPKVFVAVGSDAQPHNPHGVRPTVPRFLDQPPGTAAIQLDSLPTTPTGVWAGALMTRLRGEQAEQFANGWIGFTVTLPDEPPWVVEPAR